MKNVVRYLLIIILTAAAITAAAYFVVPNGWTKTFWGCLIIGVIGSIILLITVKYLLYRFGDGRYARSAIGKIDRMEGKEFEDYLRVKFEKRGYKVEMTPSTGDYGADLICKDKKGVLVVQAKRYEGHVGTAAVQEVVAARDYYEADRAMVVTNSYFTKNAILLADANEVELYDRDNLFEL